MDKNNKNLENFFKSKLHDFNGEAENWNTPPEIIWESASQSFPLRNKRNRKFLFFILFTAAMLGISTLVLLQYNSKISDIKPQNNNQFAINTITPNRNKDNINNEIEETKISKQTNDIKLKSTIKKVENIYSSENTANTKIEKNISPFANTNNTLKNKSLDYAKKGFVDGNVEYHSDTDIKKIKHRKAVEITNLGFVKLSPLKQDRKVIDFNISPFANIVAKKSWKWELGLSHMRFIENPLELDDEEIVLSDNAKITRGYNNLNFYASGRLSKNWSLVSGIQYSRLFADIGMQFSSFYYSEFNHLTLRSGVKDFSSASVNLNEEGQNINFNYKPGLNIQNGTPIDLDVKLSMIVRLVEMPIGIFHHWTFNKFELVTGGGISLNSIYLKMNPAIISIYYNNTLINNPIPSESIDYQEYNWNFNGSVLLKYKITNSININTFFKIDPFYWYSNRIGIGLNYRI